MSQGIDHLGLGQPMSHEPTHTPSTSDSSHGVTNTGSNRAHAVSEPEPLTTTGQEIPTTNPAVHVVIANPPATPSRVRSQTDSMLSPPSTRHRADTNASTLSFATSTTSASDMADDDDEEDDYDPAMGGDEKTCIKEKRVKEWRKRFHPREDEELMCSTLRFSPRRS